MNISENNLYRIFMWLKLLRYLQIGNISMAIWRIIDYLSDIFFLHKIMFENLYTWISAISKLVLIMHVFSCIWLGIHEYKSSQDRPRVGF